MSQKIFPNLWFDGQAEEAANFYVEVFEDAKILNVGKYPEGSPGQAGTVMYVDFELNGVRFVGINGGPQFKFSEAISFQIDCEDQAEVDYFWDRLTARRRGEPMRLAQGSVRALLAGRPDGDGGSSSTTPTPRTPSRAMEAMLKMKKIDVAALRAAAEGEPVG